MEISSCFKCTTSEPICILDFSKHSRVLKPLVQMWVELEWCTVETFRKNMSTIFLILSSCIKCDQTAHQFICIEPWPMHKALHFIPIHSFHVESFTSFALRLQSFHASFFFIYLIYFKQCLLILYTRLQVRASCQTCVVVLQIIVKASCKS